MSGGINAVLAELKLIETAINNNEYDRLVLLQGLDYPIKSNKYIMDFYNDYTDTEFICANNCTKSDVDYFTGRCRTYKFPNRKNLLKRSFNYIVSKYRVYLRDGVIHGEEDVDYYWGSAQWAITGKCARYVVNYVANNPHFMRWFNHNMCADEALIQSIVHNSLFKEKVGYLHDVGDGYKYLAAWRNLTYFEYGKNIRFWNVEDYQFIQQLPELYIRKVTSQSKALLDLLDREE